VLVRPGMCRMGEMVARIDGSLSVLSILEPTGKLMAYSHLNENSIL
jgi:hypothetical protein